MGKYADNCVTMFLKPENSSLINKSSVFMFGQEFFQAATNWVESWIVTGEITLMEGTPEGAEKIIHIGPDGHKGGPYPKRRLNADETFFFFGADPTDMNCLGGHVEFHLGEGEEKQIFEFDEPRAIYIPRGVRYGPIFFTGVYRNILVFQVLSLPSRADSETINDFDYITARKI